MSTKTKAPKTPKTTTAKPDAQRTKAVAEAQATDAAANAHAVAAAPGKATKAMKAAAGAVEKKPNKVSGLDAAFEVLKAKGEPMTCQAIVDEMPAKGMWKTNGKTPAATIYSAMLREIDGKPGEARFAKTGRGLFAVATPKKA